MKDFQVRGISDFLRQHKAFFKRGKKRVAFHLPFDQSQIEIRTKRQCLFVDLGASTDENIGAELFRIQFQQLGLEPDTIIPFPADSRQVELERFLDRARAETQNRLTKQFRMRPAEPDGVPRQNDIKAIRQRLAQAFERFSAHHHNVATGHLLEPFEILRQMPGNFVLRADHPVKRHGGYGFKVFHRVFAPRTRNRAAAPA
jgi:hypothetical protein